MADQIEYQLQLEPGRPYKPFLDHVTKGRAIQTRVAKLKGYAHRQVLLGFIAFLEREGFSSNGRYSKIIHFRRILEHCGREGWGGLPNRVLLYKQDLLLAPRLCRDSSPTR